MNKDELLKIKEYALERHIPIIMDDTLEVIDKYLTEKNDIYFILNNKEEVRIKLNISKNLFEYLLLGINMDNSIRSTQMRLRSSVESQSGPGYYMRSVMLSHSETIALMNGMQTASSHAGFWGGTLAGIIGNAAAGILVGGRFYLEGLSWSNMENNYLRGSQGGSEYIEVTHYSPTGMTYTTRQFLYH